MGYGVARVAFLFAVPVFLFPFSLAFTLLDGPARLSGIPPSSEGSLCAFSGANRGTKNLGMIPLGLAQENSRRWMNGG